jgi:hypothetical protein
VRGASPGCGRPFTGSGQEVRQPARAFNGRWWSAASMPPVTGERKRGDAI